MKAERVEAFQEVLQNHAGLLKYVIEQEKLV